MSKRLALTIAGAVSLGSFESGVLYEVLDAIRQHNAAHPNPDDQIKIDVLTGASAGGMTATILSQKLLFNGGDFVGPYNNPLYNTWVKRIDLQGLQNTQGDEDALHSIFSSDLIKTISEECLLARYKFNPIPPRQPHAAAADTLQLGLALTNLNGVDYGYPEVPAGHFIYTSHEDQMVRPIDPAANDNPEFWTPLAQAAVACGAFPFAFRAQDITRNRADYTSSPNLEPWLHNAQTAKFTYSDGGILQNQPLGMAKNLVDLVDNHLDTENRYYLFVSPNAKDSSANDNFHEANADYLHLLQRLISVVLGQSEFQDWITAIGVNAKVKLLDDRATQLVYLFQHDPAAVGNLQATANTLLPFLFPNDAHHPPGASGPETLDTAKNRIAHQFAAEMKTLGGNTPEAIALRDSILALESVAGLGARDTMQIYGVTATDKELAGAGLFAFLGFFDQQYRDHDYDLGRQKARQAFAQAAALPDGKGGLLTLLNNTAAQPINPIDHRLDGLKLAGANNNDVNRFKAGLKNRVNQMLKELIGNWSFLVDPAADLLVGSAIDQVIKKF